MIRICLVSLLAVLAGYTMSAQAEQKIAILDVQAAVQNSNYAKEIVGQLEKEFGPDADKLQKLETEIRRDEEQLQKDAKVLSQAQLVKKKSDLENKALEYQLLRKKVGKEQVMRQQEMGDKLNPVLEKVLKEIIEQEKIDFIIQREALAFGNPTYDITKKVTERLNQSKK